MFKLMTTFDGRITRKQYWIGAALMVALMIVVLLIAIAAFGIVYALTGWTPAPNSFGERLTGVIVALLVLPSGFAIMKKRVNDLDYPAWTVLLSLALVALDLVANLLGGTYFQGVGMTLVALLVIANCVWAIAIGVIPGTAGPNSHGPDPLTPAA